MSTRTVTSPLHLAYAHATKVRTPISYSDTRKREADWDIRKTTLSFSSFLPPPLRRPRPRALSLSLSLFRFRPRRERKPRFEGVASAGASAGACTNVGAGADTGVIVIVIVVGGSVAIPVVSLSLRPPWPSVLLGLLGTSMSSVVPSERMRQPRSLPSL